MKSFAKILAGFLFTLYSCLPLLTSAQTQAADFPVFQTIKCTGNAKAMKAELIQKGLIDTTDAHLMWVLNYPDLMYEAVVGWKYDLVLASYTDLGCDGYLSPDSIYSKARSLGFEPFEPWMMFELLLTAPKEDIVNALPKELGSEALGIGFPVGNYLLRLAVSAKGNPVVWTQEAFIFEDYKHTMLHRPWMQTGPNAMVMLVRPRSAPWMD